MINEEISSKSLNLEIQVAKASSREILKILKKLMKKGKLYGGFKKFIQAKGNKTKLKNIVKKGQLEDIEVKDTELKELKKVLNKYGVKFSIMRDKKTGIHSVFFQAKDTQVMNKAFQQVLKTIDKKEERKESIHKQLSHFKSVIKEVLFKDKIKNKQKEQSL